MKITKQELQQLSESLYFRLPEDLLDRLYNEADQLLIDLEKLNKLDADRLAPTDYCVPTTLHKLRKDVPIINNDPDAFLKNAKHRHGRYVVVK